MGRTSPLRTCINIALYLLLLYFVLETCVFDVTIKPGKVTQALLFFEIILEFEKNEKMCLHTLMFLLMAYWFICSMLFIAKISYVFHFSKTDALICFIENVLSIYCVKCISCDVTKNSLLLCLWFPLYNCDIHNPVFNTNVVKIK